MRRHDIQDATGVVAANRPLGITIISATSAPVASAKGYAPGCIWQNLVATGSGFVYVNTGTSSSATWIAIF